MTPALQHWRRRATARRTITIVISVVIVGIAVGLYFLASGGKASKPKAKLTAQQVAQDYANKAAVAAGCPSKPKTPLNKPHWSKPPPTTISTSKTYMAIVKTDLGPFVITLDAGQTPVTVNNFVFLADQGFYNCVIFNRVVPGFLDQTGDPTGTGTGGPGYTFSDELPKTASPQYPIGSVAMANSGPNTNGSQFFIVAGAEGENLPPNSTLFGRVTSGMSVVDKINADGNAGPSASGVPPKVVHRMLKVTISSS
jgi:cyclophilin family peptidyl-prolyl cis-trans isomerase